MSTEVQAFLGFGANLGDPQAALAAVLTELRARPDLSLVRAAPAVWSAPVGPPGQPEYLNTVLEVRTTLGPVELLAELKALERAFGRQPGVRWSARPLDLDILLYGDALIALADPPLTIPHVQLPRRSFVLGPLAALVPDLSVPGQDATVAQLLARIGGGADLRPAEES